MAENALFCTENLKNYTMRVWKVGDTVPPTPKSGGYCTPTPKSKGYAYPPYPPHSTPMVNTHTHTRFTQIC